MASHDEFFKEINYFQQKDFNHSFSAIESFISVRQLSNCHTPKQKLSIFLLNKSSQFLSEVERTMGYM